jgi:hypothetical protein
MSSYDELSFWGPKNFFFNSLSRAQNILGVNMDIKKSYILRWFIEYKFT